MARPLRRKTPDCNFQDLTLLFGTGVGVGVGPLWAKAMEISNNNNRKMGFNNHRFIFKTHVLNNNFFIIIFQ